MCLLAVASVCPIHQLLVGFNLVSAHPAVVVEHPASVKLFHLLLAQDSISKHVRVASQVTRSLFFDGLQEFFELVKDVR